jgi:hypothetical protein
MAMPQSLQDVVSSSGGEVIAFQHEKGRSLAALVGAFGFVDCSCLLVWHARPYLFFVLEESGDFSRDGR